MPTISHDDVRRAFARIEKTLIADELFVPNELPQVQARLAWLPDTVEEFFASGAQGASGAIRYAMLRLYVELVDQSQTRRPSAIDGMLDLREGEVRCFRGDLRIAGSLRLDANAQLIVAGDLFVEGSVIAASDAFTLLAVGGSLRARHVITGGEFLVSGSAIIGDVIYAKGPYYGARVGELRARTVVENSDARGVFPRIRAQQHFAERLADARRDRLRAIGRILGAVGASSVEQIEARLLRAAAG